jgi:ABC-type lipoprotein release transport system permease subunit
MLPEILALVLAAVAGAGLGHTLITTCRRHAHDVAVLAVLGGTPGQLRASLGVMAAATVLPALLLGVPLGVALARVLWWQVATGIGVAGDVALPSGLLLAIGPAVLLGALLVALVPAERAARTPPATALRTVEQ